MQNYKFLIKIKSKKINDKLLDNLYQGGYGIIHITDANENTIEKFGLLAPQDVYNKTKVTIGVKMANDEILDSTNDMLWHQDHAYSQNISPFIGLYCINASEGSSPTHYLDMQKAYKNSNDDLKEKAKNLSCKNTVSKYYRQKEHPYKFKTKAHERLYRIKSHTIRPLVMNDNYGQYYFYSEAYTETHLESQFKNELFKKEYIYSHYWKARDLLVSNNLKIIHKRDTTPKHVKRQHIRFAFTPFK